MKRILILVPALFLAFAAAAHAQAAKALPAPDLHAGGANPSSIPNHQTTEVTLPGLHLTGTSITASGVCTLKSAKVVSDTEISMEIEGDRPVDGKEDGCFLKVSQGAKSASTYVVVELTDDERHQQDVNQAAAAQIKADAYMASLGAVWTLHYADGATETLTAQPADPGQLPDFASSSGSTAKILIVDGKVVIMDGDCMLTGTVTGNQVKDGKAAAGDCKHSGGWTAQKR